MATVVTSVLSVCGAVVFMFCREANSVEMLILGRLLVGLSAGLFQFSKIMFSTSQSSLKA